MNPNIGLALQIFMSVYWILMVLGSVWTHLKGRPCFLLPRSLQVQILG